MQVKDVMTPRAIRVGPGEPVAVAARMLSRYNIGALPVCEEGGKILGLVTDRDLVLRCMAANRNPEKVPVRDVMTTKVVTVNCESSLEEAGAKMAREQVRRLPVEKNGRLCGVLSLGDLATTHQYAMESAEILSQISTGLRHR